MRDERARNGQGTGRCSAGGKHGEKGERRGGVRAGLGTCGEVVGGVGVQSLDDEREGALGKEGAQTAVRAGSAGGQRRARSPGRAPPTPLRPNTHGPGEAEGEADGVAEGGVGAARAVGDAEGVGAEDGGDGAAVGAGRLGGDAGLVVLQADAEEGLAVALLQPGASGAAPPAAVAVAEQPLLVDKLLQLQLEHPGAVNLPKTAAVSPRSGPCAPGSSR